jgi:hypothetical protein
MVRKTFDAALTGMNQALSSADRSFCTANSRTANGSASALQEICYMCGGFVIEAGLMVCQGLDDLWWCLSVLDQVARSRSGCGGFLANPRLA